MEDFPLNEEEILQHVDEYTLYCHYLGFTPDLGVKYRSPVRPDDSDPSFGIFSPRLASGREYLWKDQGTGVKGDVFKLVRLVLENNWGHCTRSEALEHIRREFNLSSEENNRGIEIPRYEPKPRPPMVIRVKSRGFNKEDLKFWKQFNIEEDLLNFYQVKPISCYWMYEAQPEPKFPRGLAFSYLIQGKYKLYFPQEKKEFKFRNNLTEQELEGYSQLQLKSPRLILTKSMKDVMCLRSFGYEAVAARSENTRIDQVYLDYFEGIYREILVLFDNDGKAMVDDYVYPKVYVPKQSGEKDISDFCKRYGPVATRELLQQLFP